MRKYGVKYYNDSDFLISVSSTGNVCMSDITFCEYYPHTKKNPAHTRMEIHTVYYRNFNRNMDAREKYTYFFFSVSSMKSHWYMRRIVFGLYRNELVRASPYSV